MQETLHDAANLQSTPLNDYLNLQLGRDPSGYPTTSGASSESDTSLQQLTDEVEECVSCLLKLVPALRDPAPQDIYHTFTSHGEPNDDIGLAKKMFPKATPSILRRLGFANWKRKQALLSLKLRDHASVSPKRGSNDGKQQNPNTQQFANLSIGRHDARAAAFSPHAVASSPGSSGAGAASIDESIFSELDYFSSRSVTSVATSDQANLMKRFDVPKPPVTLTNGSTFDCAYCGQEIICGLQVSSDDDWNIHVFLDLEPYMCTFDDCLRADKTFGIREDWFQHELNHHRLRKIWFCQPCNHSFDEVEDIELHITEKHKKSDDSSELSLMVSLCERYSGEGIPSQACPFCGFLSAKMKALEEHIADHMEQFALASVQSVYGPEKDGDNHTREDSSSSNKVKLEILKSFLDKQHEFIWKRSQASFIDGAAGSNVAFAEDSDDEAVHQDVHFHQETAAPAEKSVRPPMKRRGDSWMTKVDSFLEEQSTELPGKKPWLSKVQTFLETQFAQGGAQKDSKVDISAGSPGDRRPSINLFMTPPCLRTNPPPRNKDFIGRDSDLTRLHEILSKTGTAYVVAGASGMGKTDTAIEYTYRHEKAYSYIFWVSAETPISCADTYSLIASEFLVSEDDVAYEQARLITLGREFLEQTEMRWLLVFDNVTSWSNVWQYIPTQLQQTSGSILITSRIHELVDTVAMPQYEVLELNTLTLEESRRFLLKSMKSSLEDKDLSSHPEYNLAGVIAREAEGLPLALSHIAGYVQVSECTLTDFVELWTERRRHTKSSDPTVNTSMLSTDKALETVWNIGLREVTIDARDLLNILAFLDSDKIQRKLLIGEHEEASLDFLHSNQAFRSDIAHKLEEIAFFAQR